MVVVTIIRVTARLRTLTLLYKENGTIANLYCVREKEMMLGDLIGGSYGVASIGTGLVKRLQRPFVLVEELFNGL